MYGEVLEDYVDVLAGRLRKGKISRETFIRLTDKLIAWENLAARRRLM